MRGRKGRKKSLFILRCKEGKEASTYSPLSPTGEGGRGRGKGKGREKRKESPCSMARRGGDFSLVASGLGSEEGEGKKSSSSLAGVTNFWKRKKGNGYHHYEENGGGGGKNGPWLLFLYSAWEGEERRFNPHPPWGSKIALIRWYHQALKISREEKRRKKRVSALADWSRREKREKNHELHRERGNDRLLEKKTGSATRGGGKGFLTISIRSEGKGKRRGALVFVQVPRRKGGST